MRLIDADEFKNWLMDNYICYDHTLEDIDKQPTIEAEPIRHGKWNRNKIVYMECSECGWLFEYYGGLEEEWNYCPHCGCKMDKVNDD